MGRGRTMNHHWVYGTLETALDQNVLHVVERCARLIGDRFAYQRPAHARLACAGYFPHPFIR